MVPWRDAARKARSIAQSLKRQFAGAAEPEPKPVNDRKAVSYEGRLAEEERRYRTCVNVHELPPIFHYWSNRYLRPKLEAFGFSNPADFFARYLERQCRRDAGKLNLFISIGSGNCDTEVSLCRSLVNRGVTNFRLECLDLNDAMLQRGRQLAMDQGVLTHIAFVKGDFNDWRPARKYDAVVANQSLHHVLKIDKLLKAIKGSLRPDGVLVLSDMIGRNGHLRWPEALEIVQEFWNELPAEFRYNQQLTRHEEQYENWDCSTEGFEGIRAQDILPLLNKHFKFELFVPFANVVDIFIDRAFGHNFDPGREWDRDFIDRVHARDEDEMRSGRIKPTHLIAVARSTWPGPMQHYEPLTPEFCVRRP